MHDLRTEAKIAMVRDALRKEGGWPALWSALNGMYTSSCGNGLDKADQQQYANLDLPVGEYDLKEY